LRTYFLAFEFLLLFGALPLVASIPLLRVPHVPVLLAAAAGCAIALRRDPTFPRRQLWNGGAVPTAADALLRRTFAAAIAIVTLVAAAFPERLLDLPRQRPLVWAGIVILYPLAVAWPLEIVYRAFLMHRYRPIFGDGALAVAASAVAFSVLHAVHSSWLALALALPAGVVLALTYLRTGSLAASTLEHAALAILVFSIGLGGFFLAGRI
jgi:membrane protease YdiL (CAAX protease family)